MPSIRIGFSTDFNLTSEQVGIGTTRPTARLDVRGQVRSDNASGSGGISTLTEYQGFLHSKQGIGNTVSIAQTTKGNLNSLSGELVISGEVTVSEGTSIGAGRLDSLTVTSSFDLPRGGSTNRPVAPEKGNTRFNQDLGQLEFYTGYEWRTVGSIDGSGRGRGVFGGGLTPSVNKSLEYINISSQGNAINFGDLITARFRFGACSSATRGLFGGGINPTTVSIIEYISIASEGNAIEFGNLSVGRATAASSCSSSTRGLWAGGYNPSSNVIDYVEINTLGTAQDFGDLRNLGDGANGEKNQLMSCSSPTRGVWAGGSPSPAGTIQLSSIDFVTISSKGNAINGGELTQKSFQSSAFSNSVRGIFGENRTTANTITTNVLSFVTLSSLGNAIDFGDLTIARFATGSTSSQIRGVIAGGYTGALFNTIDYVTIMSSGNAQDFGDLTKQVYVIDGCSDSHGGLGGF